MVTCYLCGRHLAPNERVQWITVHMTKHMTGQALVCKQCAAKAAETK